MCVCGTTCAHLQMCVRSHCILYQCCRTMRFYIIIILMQLYDYAMLLGMSEGPLYMTVQYCCVIMQYIQSIQYSRETLEENTFFSCDKF